MKNTLRSKIKAILSLVLTVLLCTVFAVLSFSAEDDFETKIAAFPESYKPYLRQLHASHPNWEFEPFFTTLDFNEAVDNECGLKSLVSASASSDVFKSKDIGDYNYSKDAYIYKDGGFVEANRLAVAYFMDPRNFLNEDGIFQFELLSFNDSFTVEAVENVLKGSFMHNTKITYLNSKGKTKKTSTKYSQAIYNAGKAYNVNPCFLASKILNEVGTAGSKSVSGNHSTYPGIYNFYNIGATDGSGAIARGLKWASSGTTYSRPWNTPVKSINGGAEYIVESYIACGQFTGYLQRFNVNPNNNKHSVYTHQYMTNLTGALSQGYSTYVSYAKSGLLENKYVFSIPVYENMPSETSTSGYGRFVDSTGQTGEISANTVFVRTGPSTYNGKLLDSSGGEIKLVKGQSVDIIEIVNTDSDYYLSVLQYPYWYKISFICGGNTYIGYVPENFVDITEQICVGVGTYSPSFFKSDPSLDLQLVSYDANIAQIVDSYTVNFLKKGTVYIGAYDSLGRFDKVKFVVSDNALAAPEGAYLTDVTPISAVLNFTADASVTEYEVIAADNTGNISHKGITAVSPYFISGLQGGHNYNIVLRAVIEKSDVMKYGPAVSIPTTTLPDDAVITKVSKSRAGDVTIHWNALNGIGGYYVYYYDSEAQTYNLIDTLAPNVCSYTLPAAHTDKYTFSVCAYGILNGEAVTGRMSAVVDTRNIPGGCSGAKPSDVYENGYTLTWNTVEGTRYNIYKENNGVYEPIKVVKKASYKVKKAGYSAFSKYRITAFKTISGVVYEGAPTKNFSVTTTPAAVTNLKVSATAKGGKFTWNAVDNATSYIVYIYNDSKKKYVKKATVTKNSYTMSDKKPGRTYKIRVKACIKTSFGRYYGQPATVSFYTRPERVVQIKTTSLKTTSFNLSWDKTGGTSKYYLYQYNSKKKKYVKIATLTSPKYYVNNLKAGTTYKYKVKTVKIVNGKTVSTNTSPVISVSTRLASVTSVSASRKKKFITLSWNKVKGATKYQIYKYDSSKKKYVRIATVDNALKYKVSGLKPGRTYKFKIRPVKILDGKKYYGAYSSVFTFKTKS